MIVHQKLFCILGGPIIFSCIVIYSLNWLISHFNDSWIWLVASSSSQDNQLKKLLLVPPICEIMFIAILENSLLLPYIYRSSNFLIAKVVALNFLLNILLWISRWFMASFLYCFLRNYHSSNYCDSNGCRFFTLLIVKSNGRATTIGIAIVRKAITLERAIKKRSKKRR